VLRKDIPLESPVVATAKHGERLEIVQHRRRFMKVRTPSGVEGWTEDRLLLSAKEIADLMEVERRARTLPSQGVASTYELLNVHTEPDRFSPSFLQVKAGERVDVIGHVIASRTPSQPKSLIARRPKTFPSKKRAETRYPALPMPPAPPVPANWLELSKTPPEVLQEIVSEKAQAERALPTDDWSLVRNAQGESGWVVTRRLYMAIPDDVAQYAEGHRITSYFALGEVRDGDQVKHNWVWTTIGGGDHPYDFDSFRVFTWNLRRHRFETAYIQRNVEGYFPVLPAPVEFGAARSRGAASTARYPGFSVCTVNADGARVRRSYAFISPIVRFAGERPCEPAGSLVASQDGTGRTPAPPGSQSAAPSLYTRLKSSLGALAKKWFDR